MDCKGLVFLYSKYFSVLFQEKLHTMLLINCDFSEVREILFAEENQYMGSSEDIQKVHVYIFSW